MSEERALTDRQPRAGYDPEVDIHGGQSVSQNRQFVQLLLGEWN